MNKRILKSNIEEKTLFEKRGLDIFSSIMTEELKNEMNQLLTEQQNFQNEINQLKKERNFLFTLLKKQKSKNLNNKVQIRSQNFSFVHQEQVSIPPAEILKINKSSQFTVNVESSIDSSSALNDKKYSFSKNFFLSEIRKYFEIPLFERSSKILELSKNGDSMVSFFVNTVGNAIISFDKKFKRLNKEIEKLKNAQRESTINSIESLAESKKQDLDVLTKIIESLDFGNNNIDNDIFTNMPQIYAFSNHKEIDEICIDELNIDDLNDSSDLNLNLLINQSNGYNFYNINKLNDFTEFNLYL